MSLHSSSKPHSVANNLGLEKFNLVFKQTSNSKKLTQDALYVCQLLAIHPDDLAQRDLYSFAEKGLSEKRQLLRYEHYEEKRQLKLKAIQNVLIKCQAKDQINSAEGYQVQALIDDLKRQRSNTNPRNGMGQSQYSPFKTQKYNSNAQNASMSGIMQTGEQQFYAGEMSVDKLNQSQFIEMNAAKQMDRVMGKLEKWNKIKEMSEKKKQEQEDRVNKMLQQEKKKFDLIEKNQKERMEDLKARFEYKKSKWEGKVNSKLDEEKKLEKEKIKKALDLINETQEFFETKIKKEKQFYSKYNRPEIDGGLLASNNNSMSQPYYSSRLLNTSESQDLDSDLQKLQQRLKEAEERNKLKQQSIRNRGQNHSLLIQEKKTLYEQREKLKFESLLSKTVEKAMRTKSKQDGRLQDISRTAGKLSEVHKIKEEKLKQQQEEERRTLQEQLKMQSRKQDLKEQILKQKRETMLDQISGKKEKRKLQFQDKEENEKRIKMMQFEQKQLIFEKHIEKEKKIIEMKNQWKSQYQSVQ